MCIGINFNCSMLGGGRVLLARVAGADAATLYYQPHPGEGVVHRVLPESCLSRPGAVCLNPVLVDPAYATTLRDSGVPFRCGMASGRPETWA